MGTNIKICNHIMPEARLTFSRIKGSVSVRNKLAAEYNARFYKELNKHCPNEICDIEQFKKVLDRVLYPDKIHYVVKNETDERFSGGLNSIISLSQKNAEGDIQINHTGYEIKIKNSHPDKYTLIHETSHLFDHLCNPKYNIFRLQNLINSPKDEKLYDKINNIFLINLNKPVKMKKLKQESNKLLAKLSPEAAIDVLQRLRYKLTTEINAYKNELKARFRDKPLNSINLFILICRNFKFKSKLNYVNNALKTQLADARKNYSTTD